MLWVCLSPSPTFCLLPQHQSSSFEITDGFHPLAELIEQRVCWDIPYTDQRIALLVECGATVDFVSPRLSGFYLRIQGTAKRWSKWDRQKTRGWTNKRQRRREGAGAKSNCQRNPR